MLNNVCQEALSANRNDSRTGKAEARTKVQTACHCGGATKSTTKKPLQGAISQATYVSGDERSLDYE